jgi:hypothetical protein
VWGYATDRPRRGTFANVKKRSRSERSWRVQPAREHEEKEDGQLCESARQAGLWGALVSRRARLVCSPSTAMPRARGIIGRSIKKNASTYSVAELRDEALFKDPPPGLPHLLPTNARTVNFVCLASTRD